MLYGWPMVVMKISIVREKRKHANGATIPFEGVQESRRL
jgi:hypothetical protein